MHFISCVFSGALYMQNNTLSGKRTAETNLTVNYNMSSLNSPFLSRSSPTTSVTRLVAVNNSNKEDHTLSLNFWYLNVLYIECWTPLPPSPPAHPPFLKWRNWISITSLRVGESEKLKTGVELWAGLLEENLTLFLFKFLRFIILTFRNFLLFGKL